jgi:hypothetical protein
MVDLAVFRESGPDKGVFTDIRPPQAARKGAHCGRQLIDRKDCSVPRPI